MKFDTEIHADYSKENGAQHRVRHANAAQALYDGLNPVSQRLWHAVLKDFLRSVRTINERGGCVVAICFSLQGELYDYKQRLFPKQEFWPALAGDPYLPTVHFESLTIV